MASGHKWSGAAHAPKEERKARKRRVGKKKKSKIEKTRPRCRPKMRPKGLKAKSMIYEENMIKK